MDARLQRRVQRYGWDKASSIYENSWERQLRPAQDRLLELAALKPGDEVLDVACGTGLVTFRAAATVGETGRVVGTDLSGKMVEMAAERVVEEGLRHVEFRREDGEDLSFASNSFDVALCALGLLYFPDPLKGLKEMYRVLRPGGRAVAAVWGRRDRCGWAAIFDIVDARVKTEVCPLFFRLGTRDALEFTFQEAGFEKIQVDRITTVLRYGSPEEALEAAFAGGPVALAYSHFDEETRRQAHAEYLESISPFRREESFEIPGEFVVASGFKAASPSGFGDTTRSS